MSKVVKTKVREQSDRVAFEAAVRDGIAEADAGKLIDYEKIRRWLLSWGSDKELPPPK